MAATINNTMTKIQTVTVGSGGAATISFTSIPTSGYTDLLVKLSLRTDRAANNIEQVKFRINSDSGSNYTYRRIYGDGSAAASDSGTSTYAYGGWADATSSTANVFASNDLYIPNYTSSNQKSFSFDAVTENNATAAFAVLTSGLWTGTSAITSITFYPDQGNNFVQYSTATLYGITATPNTTKASGGIIYQDATYMYHVFPYSSTFTPSAALTADVLCIAGGGGGGYYYNGGGGAGGGAGGVVYSAGISLASGTAYTATVGAGGAGSTTSANGTSGSNSNLTGGSISLTASVGGGGGGSSINSSLGGNGTNGGSGGGGGGASSTTGGTSTQGGGGSTTAYYGNAGGAGVGVTAAGAGGGGGAGAAGGNGTGSAGGAGGVGTTAYSSWAIATNTGQIVSGTGYYAGGGGGGVYSTTAMGLGGYGGGGTPVVNSGSTPGNGLVSTGGGGGGSAYGTSAGPSGAGGSGVIIIRYTK